MFSFIFMYDIKTSRDNVGYFNLVTSSFTMREKFSSFRHKTVLIPSDANILRKQTQREKKHNYFLKKLSGR